VKRTVIFYGVLGGALIAALRIIEYRFLVLAHSLEIRRAAVFAPRDLARP
jgi:hypothetical protein